MKWEDLDSLVAEEPLEKERNERRNTIILWLFAIISHGTIMYLVFFKFDTIKEFVHSKEKMIVEHVEPERRLHPLPTPPASKPRIQSAPRPTTPQVAQRPTEPFPGTMLVVVKGNQGACPLTFDARDIQLDSVITLFNYKTGERVSWGYLAGGVSATIRLSPGEYDLITISGEEWHGRIEMFGAKSNFRRTSSPFVIKLSRGECSERVISMRKFIAKQKL
jgi:hypothetical protein